MVTSAFQHGKLRCRQHVPNSSGYTGTPLKRKNTAAAQQFTPHSGHVPGTARNSGFPYYQNPRIGEYDRSDGTHSVQIQWRSKQEGKMQLTPRQEEYWHKNLVVTAILLTIWFVVTFVAGWFSRELNSISILGFPLGFYNAAQGALIVYVLLIWYYQHYMNKLDIEYGVHEGEDE
jgi:putative solute:sodium symporter small subunit